MDSKSKVAQSVGKMKPNPNVLFRRLGDEIVLFHLQTDHFYELNGTAARFWELLCEGSDTRQVREQMIEEFAVDPDEFTRQAESLLTSLLKEDLVSVDD